MQSAGLASQDAARESLLAHDPSQIKRHAAIFALAESTRRCVKRAGEKGRFDLA